MDIIKEYDEKISEQREALRRIKEKMTDIFLKCSFGSYDFHIEVDIYGTLSGSWHKYGLRDSYENISVLKDLNQVVEHSGIKQFVMALSHVLDGKMSINMVICNIDDYRLLLNELSHEENACYNSDDHVAYLFQNRIIFLFWYLPKEECQKRIQKK